MVHVAAPLVRRDGVELLLHAWHAQGGHVDDLGLAALEQSRTVRHREEVDFGRKGTNIGRTTTVNTHTFVDDATTNDLLGQRLNGSLDFTDTVEELGGQLGHDFGSSRAESLGTRRLGGQLVGFANLAGTNGLHASHDVVFVVTEHGVGNGLNRTTLGDVHLHHFALEID